MSQTSQDAGGETVNYGGVQVNYPAAVTANGQFNIQAYLAARPDLATNYVSDPANEQQWGSLANYALADAAANGGPQITQLIQAGSITLPDGATISNNSNGVPNINVGTSALADTTLLPSMGYSQQAGVGENNIPLEQGLLQSALPIINNSLNQSQSLVDQTNKLTDQTNQAYGNLGSQLQQAVAGFDGNAYVKANPDAAAAWQAYQQGGGTQDINAWAQGFYQQKGNAEGEKATYTSSLLQAEQGNAATVLAQQTQAAQTAASGNLNALINATSSLQSNLQGALGQQATALAQNLQQLQANAGQYGTAASAALTQQINQQVQNLQTSIASQKQNLQTEIQQLQGANTAESQQQLAALQTELGQLNAAEAPVAAARTQAAQLQVTAVNLGLQQQQAQIKVQNAANGYTGSGTMENQALARAAIGAQQQGAAAVGNASLLNAQDTQTIANQGATGQDAIANTTAQQGYGITTGGAEAGNTLANNLATGTQNLQDTGAAGQATIQNTVAQQLEAAANANSNQQYANTNAGITAAKNISDAGTTGIQGIATGLNNSVQGFTNQNAAANASYFDQLAGQSLTASQGLAALPTQQASSIATIAALPYTGLTNAQQALNWWATNATPPATTTALTSAGTAGNGIASLGAGLLNSAVSVGNSQKWWQTPTTTDPNASSSNPYDG